MGQKDADGMVNSVDPDQTALYTVCPGLPVWKLRIITVVNVVVGVIVLVVKM